MELNLVQPNHPALRQIADVNIFEANVDVAEFENAMLDLMGNRFGIGLASPQVGASYNMFVMNHSVHGEIGVYNPEILESSEKTISREEGCLTFPLLFMFITRPDTVKVRYTKTDGVTVVEEELFERDSQCFQHEYDHLQGKLFLDDASDLKVRRAIAQRDKRVKKLQKSLAEVK